MCGRFAFYSPTEATAALFGATSSLDVEPRYNIAPTQYVAAVRDGDDRELVMLRWGLVPFWAKDPSIGNRLINARAETVAEKPSFRNAYKKRRCLVLANGFYEWHRDGDVKTPHFISLADGSPFAFAGLWESWTSKEDDENLQTTAIITTVANEFMEQIDHRMPVVIKPDNAGRWLEGDMQLLSELIDEPPQFRAWPVERTVNNARNEGEKLIEPAGDAVT